MIQTNDKHFDADKRYYIRQISVCFLCVAFFSLLFFGKTVNAATLKIHNYVSDDTYDYTGVSVFYVVNDKEIDAGLPGLVLQNGGAVGPFREVFADPLGATTDYKDGLRSFSVYYGANTVKMTLGNTEAEVNGKKVTMINAPFVYSFGDSDEKHLYVPTRFLAETFGFVYTWNSAESTAYIQRPNYILDGTKKINYSDITPFFYLNHSVVSVAGSPGYIFDDTVFFSAEKFFQNTGMAAYAYDEASGLIVLKKEATMIRLVIDSPVAYVNDTPYLLKTVPRLITPQDATKAQVYIPAEFVSKALGYEVTYNEENFGFYVSGDLLLSDTDYIFFETSDLLIPDSSSYGEVLFTQELPKQLIDYYEKQEISVPKKIAAYACMNSDALYLQGIQENQVTITDKSDVIEITFFGYRNPFQRRTYYNPDAAFLNYCYINGTEDLKLILLKTKELYYYTYAVPNGCVIHFTDASGMHRDVLQFSGLPSEENSGDMTDIFMKEEDFSNLYPNAIFTRNHFVIPLPENIDYSKLVDSDQYENKRFTIAIPGNHMAFFTEQDMFHQIESLKNVQFGYKVADNSTIITFHTTKIQGYSITIADGLLGVEIADPPEIYDKIIVLDAGHGGIDPGTSRSNVLEKNVNFNVINRYAPEYFKDSDIKVYYTRTTDTKIALQDRADFAKKVGADFFISFHVNANSSASVHGTSVYYSSANNKAAESGLKSSVIASTVCDKLSSAWGTKNRGVLTENFVVVHNNTVPAILIECGFITNNSDFEKIKDTSYQKKAAEAIYDSVCVLFEKYPTKR
ncbi:MAG: N-acetylmuramoyl-L-alanine amidase [Lachnospiraceae bacterium]|nr:N-acetylmuramoyl-L-alanine amidase [Lachnospiraceae bacterium]